MTATAGPCIPRTDSPLPSGRLWSWLPKMAVRLLPTSMKVLEICLDENTANHTLEYRLRQKLGLTRRQISQAKFREQGICING